MVKFSKKVNYCLLLFLITLNIILRFPFRNHVAGCDSFFLWSLADSISAKGYAVWLLHPLSVFGLYPVSYPIGLPVIFSGVSQVCGLNMELTIILVVTFFGVFGCLSAYIVAGKIMDDDIFKLVVAFTFSVSPLFLFITTREDSARGPFLALLPLFLYFAIQIYTNKKNRIKFAVFGVFTMITLSTFHRMFILLAVILVGFILAIFLYTFITSVSRYLRNRIKRVARNICYLFIIILFIVLFLPQVLIPDITTFLGGSYYRSGFFFKGDSPYIFVVNAIIDNASNIGILSIFAIMGAISLIKFKNWSFQSMFVLITLLILSAIIISRIYVSYFVLPFLAVLVGLGVAYTYTKLRKHKKKVISVIVGMCVVTVAFSKFMIMNWTAQIHEISQGREIIMDDRSYSVGIYLKYKMDGTLISTDPGLVRRLTAVSGRTALVEADYPLLLIFGFLDYKEIETHIRKPPPRDIFHFREIYSFSYLNQPFYIIVSRDCNSEYLETLKEKYDLRYVVENKYIEGKGYYWWSSYKLYPSVFLISIKNMRYIIFSNEKITVYYY